MYLSNAMYRLNTTFCIVCGALIQYIYRVHVKCTYTSIYYTYMCICIHTCMSFVWTDSASRSEVEWNKNFRYVIRGYGTLCMRFFFVSSFSCSVRLHIFIYICIRSYILFLLSLSLYPLSVSCAPSRVRVLCLYVYIYEHTQAYICVIPVICYSYSAAL